jgi:hypothetical protein
MLLIVVVLITAYFYLAISTLFIIMIAYILICWLSLWIWIHCRRWWNIFFWICILLWRLYFVISWWSSIMNIMMLMLLSLLWIHLFFHWRRWHFFTIWIWWWWNSWTFILLFMLFMLILLYLRIEFIWVPLILFILRVILIIV